jgi:hypothetical protein
MKRIIGIIGNPDLDRNILRKIKEGEMTTVVNNHEIKDFMRSQLDPKNFLNIETTKSCTDKNGNPFEKPKSKYHK